MRTVTVESYCIERDTSWDVYEESGDHRSGDVLIERYGPTDRWIIRLRRGSGWLRRDALRWRSHHAAAPLSMPDDRDHDAPAERKEIRRMFDHPAQNSSRSDDWNDDHAFTLAEAFFVCGTEAP